MKTFFASVVFCVAAACSFAAVTAESALSAVTVYADRALVSREAEVAVDAGLQEVVFGNLPAGIFDDSVQVSGAGVEARILDVSTRVEHVAASPDAAVAGLEARLEALNREDRALADRVKSIQREEEVVKNIENAATRPVMDLAKGEQVELKASWADWERAISFGAEQRERIAGKLRGVEVERAELGKKIAAVRAQLGELQKKQPQGKRAVKVVTVRVDAAQAGKLKLELNYVLGGASWVPAYDARLSWAERSVELAYFGVVRNRTGEDWKDVVMTLSTARPNLGAGAAELGAWFLKEKEKMKMVTAGKSFVTNAVAMNAEMVTLDEFMVKAQPPAPARASYAQASVEASGTSASFRIEARVSVAGDGAPQKSVITTAKLPAELIFEATPRVAETVFLSAKLENKTEFPFLPGKVSSFVEGAFVAAGQLKAVMPAEKFRVAFGADEGISIKRKRVSRFVEDTGFTSKYKKVTYEFLVALTNNKKSEESVTFRDVVPTSQNERIVVKLLSPLDRDIGTPDKPRAIVREAGNVLAWKVDLKAGEKREVPLKFSVEYPADMDVAGLE